MWKFCAGQPARDVPESGAAFSYRRATAGEGVAGASAVQLQLNRRGFAMGGAEVNVQLEATLYNSGLKAVSMLEQGTLAKVKGRAYAMGVSPHLNGDACHV